MEINYHNRRFKTVSNSANGAVETGLIFHYKQEGNIVTCTYSGDTIKHGQLLGIVDEKGVISMRYQQVQDQDEIRTGRCVSTPEVLKTGLIRLHEKWQWTSGDHSNGASILEEIKI